MAGPSSLWPLVLGFVGLGAGVDGVPPLGLTPLVLGLPVESLGGAAVPLQQPPLHSGLGLLDCLCLRLLLAQPPGAVPVAGLVAEPPLGRSPLEQELLGDRPFLWEEVGSLFAATLA